MLLYHLAQVMLPWGSHYATVIPELKSKKGNIEHGPPSRHISFHPRTSSLCCFESPTDRVALATRQPGKIHKTWIRCAEFTYFASHNILRISEMISDTRFNLFPYNFHSCNTISAHSILLLFVVMFRYSKHLVKVRERSWSWFNIEKVNSDFTDTKHTL